MDPLIALLALVTLVVTVIVLTARVIRLDRPVTPPRSTTDWRDEALSWRHLGIR